MRKFVVYFNSNFVTYILQSNKCKLTRKWYKSIVQGIVRILQLAGCVRVWKKFTVHDVAKV